QHESDIYDKGRELVMQGLDKGIFHKERDGAVYVDLTDQGLDKKYLLRADGTTIYITQDMYLWHLRNEKHHPDAAVVTTSSEQAYHFNVLAKIFELLQFPWAQNFRHLPYEHVYLGKSKMSSRGGNVVSADDLLEMTKEKVLATMQASQKVKGSADDSALVEDIAFGAIKYGYLKYDRNTKIYFDLDETIAIEGNTGPYLQYTNARIKSILEKAGKFKQAAPDALQDESELLLARHLLHYDHTVATAAREFRPNLLCNYLLELAQKFNLFYDRVSVLNADNAKQKQARLNLLVSVSNVFKNGLALLGIKAPEKM
ncbi:arginine--tRNA ligase, partial [Patescibacteria group bacterium]|nr:arginine--tRNA ligase [Patescibacteria group bacterium]